MFVTDGHPNVSCAVNLALMDQLCPGCYANRLFSLALLRLWRRVLRLLLESECEIHFLKSLQLGNGSLIVNTYFYTDTINGSDNKHMETFVPR